MKKHSYQLRGALSCVVAGGIGYVTSGFAISVVTGNVAQLIVAVLSGFISGIFVSIVSIKTGWWAT